MFIVVPAHILESLKLGKSCHCVFFLLRSVSANMLYSAFRKMFPTSRIQFSSLVKRSHSPNTPRTPPPTPQLHLTFPWTTTRAHKHIIRLRVHRSNGQVKYRESHHLVLKTKSVRVENDSSTARTLCFVFREISRLVVVWSYRGKH